jgi:acetyltransferase
VRIRPITVSDAELIRIFVRSLSFETRYLRFMGAVTDLSAHMLDRLTRIDSQREAALIGIANTDGVNHVVGVARYAANVDGESCDFAIVVADDWQRRGLGSHLLTLLVDTASSRGFKRMRGDVLAVNAPMAAFAKAHGFSVTASPGEPTLVSVERPLECERG